MPEISVVLAVFSLIVSVLVLLYLRRCDQVAKLREQVLDEIKPGDADFYEKLSRFNEVTYDDMLWSTKRITRENFYGMSEIQRKDAK